MSPLKLLQTIHTRISNQTSVGIVSADPDNEDPQHEFTELLPDIEGVMARCLEPSNDLVEAALGALKGRSIDGRQFWTDEDKALMRAALIASFQHSRE